jgi:multicomponent Na+:H+ antiporter subunit D
VLQGAHVGLPVPKPSHVSSDDYGYAVVAVAGALLTACLGLFGRGLRESLPSAIRDPNRGAVAILRGLHDGHIGDYIAWWSAGASVIGGVCLIALR